MKNKSIVEKLLDIKQQVAKLGMEFLETQEPIPLSDIGLQLSPFIKIDSSIDQALKKFSSDVLPGSIPKSNSLKS